MGLGGTLAQTLGATWKDVGHRSATLVSGPWRGAPREGCPGLPDLTSSPETCWNSRRSQSGFPFAESWATSSQTNRQGLVLVEILSIQTSVSLSGWAVGSDCS